jgi:hypothetical protein
VAKVVVLDYLECLDLVDLVVEIDAHQENPIKDQQ